MKHFFLLIVFVAISTIMPTWQKHKEYIIILDPAGDARRMGRTVENSFERGLTLQCAESIKLLIEASNPLCKVIISRLPGDLMYELHNASLSNRMDAHLFINMNFYCTQDSKPTLFLYQFSYNNNFIQHAASMTFSTYDQAYTINKTTTDLFVQQFLGYILQKNSSLFTVRGPYKIPIKPLIGIIAPSIAIEIGLQNKDSWQQVVEPLAHGIIAIINHIETI